MSNSKSAFYTQMQNYQKKISDFTNKKNQYSNYCEKLKKVKNFIINVEESMEKAKNHFSSGGYVVDGLYFDEENYKIKYDLIEGNIDLLINIIVKTELCIEDYEKQINQYTSLYEQAKRNYNNIQE